MIRLENGMWVYEDLASSNGSFVAGLRIWAPALLPMASRSWLYVAFGIATGTFMWVAVAVFGVQKIFDAAPALQTGLRAVGGLYLLYLRASNREPPSFNLFAARRIVAR